MHQNREHCNLFDTILPHFGRRHPAETNAHAHARNAKHGPTECRCCEPFFKVYLGINHASIIIIMLWQHCTLPRYAVAERETLVGTVRICCQTTIVITMRYPLGVQFKSKISARATHCSPCCPPQEAGGWSGMQHR